MVLEYVVFESGHKEGPLKDVISGMTLNLLCLSAAFEHSQWAEREIVMRTRLQGVDKGETGSDENLRGLKGFSGGFWC